MVSFSDLFTSSWYGGNTQLGYHPHTLYIPGKQNEKALSFADTKSLFLDMNGQDVVYECHGKAVGKSRVKAFNSEPVEQNSPTHADLTPEASGRHTPK